MSRVSFDDTEVAFAGKDDQELQKSAWLFRIMSNSTIVDIGAHITQLALQIGLPVQSILKATIYEHFCGGEQLAETEPTISALAAHDVSTILDYGVEAKETQEEVMRLLNFFPEWELTSGVFCLKKISLTSGIVHFHIICTILCFQKREPIWQCVVVTRDNQKCDCAN